MNRHVLSGSVWRWGSLFLILTPGCPYVESWPRSSCPPAVLGMEYNLEWLSKIHGPPRSIAWSMKFPNGSSDEISHCYHTETNCFDFYNEYTPSRRHETDDSLYHYKIHIVNVTLSLQGAQIIVRDFPTSGRMGELLHACTMDVQTPPVSPTCDAVVVSGGRRVDITCEFPMVLPGVNHCELYQMDVYTQTITKLEPDESDIEYDERPSRDGMHGGVTYKEVSCSIRVSVPHNGKYQYKAKMHSRVQERNRSKTHLTSTSLSRPVFVIESIHRVRVQAFIEIADLCPNQPIPIRASCIAEGFESRPAFSWYYNGRHVSASTSIGCYSTADEHTSRFVEKCTLDVDISGEKEDISSVSLSCEAALRSTEPSKREFGQGSLNISLRTPKALEAVLKVSHGNMRPYGATGNGGNLRVAVGSKLSLVCEAKGGGGSGGGDASEKVTNITSASLGCRRKEFGGERGVTSDDGLSLLRSASQDGRRGVTMVIVNNGIAAEEERVNCDCVVTQPSHCAGHDQASISITLTTTNRAMSGQVDIFTSLITVLFFRFVF